MKKLLIILSLCFSFLFNSNAQPVMINIGSTTVETSTIYTTTQLPWELKYGPDGFLWMTTREGYVYKIDPTTGNSTLLLNYASHVWQSAESGMLGMAFHPDFPNTPYVYIVYTYTNAGVNKERLSRFTYESNALSGEFVVIDNITAATNHDGSRLLILPDNTILMTTGDAINQDNGQDMSSLNGKILRVNLDGSIPANNPFPGSRIYTLGHRNPQGLMLHPNGKVYETEHGPDENDEFQVIEAGRNYGWPNVHGYCDNDINGGEISFCTANNVKEPLVAWNPLPAGTWAPNDLTWYSNASIPEFQNSILVVFLKTMKLRSIRLNAAGTAITSQTDFFVNQWGRLRDITTSPSGDIYLATNTSPFSIIRIRNSVALPVSIVNFKTVCKQNVIELQWTTEQESNSRRFLIYRSTNARDFYLATTVVSKAPAGNSGIPIQYSITDNPAGAGKVFYKLVSEDINGVQKEYAVIGSNCNSGSIDFSLSENPTHTQTTLNINGTVSSPVIVNIYNTAGQKIYTAKTASSILLPSDRWSKGIYLIIVSDQQNEVLYRNKLVLQ